MPNDEPLAHGNTGAARPSAPPSAAAQRVARAVVSGDRAIARLLVAGLAAAAALRCLLSAILPLADTTEARYAEIVRVGLENGFWLMPHAAPGEPFLAKPPGSTWLAMVSGSLVGPSEGALRLPSLLLMAAVALIVAAVIRRRSGNSPDAALAGAAIVVTAPIGFVLAGAVMTDAAQLLAVSSAMACATALRTSTGAARARWRYAFWTAVGLGTLAKGFATLALIGLPIALHTLFARDTARVLRDYLAPGPILVAAAIALPWYLAAEHAHPGFLRYFVVGEHLQRYLEPGWQGDRYGTAHRQPVGMIWPYAATAAGPWLAAAAVAMAADRGRKARAASVPCSADDAAARRDDTLWWACWILAPLLLFTFSRNIIWTYTATALPQFAVWLAPRLAGPGSLPSRRRAVAWGVLLWIAVLAALVPTALRAVSRHSAKVLIEAADFADPDRRLALTVPGALRFSGAFYSQGRACIAADAASSAACEARAGGSGWWIVAPTLADAWVADGQAERVADDGRHVLVRRPARTGDAR